MKISIKEILRWAAILPASAISATLCCAIILFLILIGDLLSGEIWLYLKHPEILPLNYFFLSFGLFAAFGYVFVSVGAAISPRYKKITAFILFAIVASVFGFIIIASLLATRFSDSWRLLANSVVCIVAAGACSFLVEDEN